MLPLFLYLVHIMLDHATSCTLCFDGDIKKGSRIARHVPSLMSAPQAYSEPQVGTWSVPNLVTLQIMPKSVDTVGCR
jgi:hypothetical protein